MRRRTMTGALALLALGGCPGETAWAQASEKPPAAAPAHARPQAAQEGPFAIEGRFGALWPQPPLVVDASDAETSTTRFVMGGRASWYFTSHLDRRLNVQFVFDYGFLGSSEYVDPGLESPVQREGHWYAVPLTGTYSCQGKYENACGLTAYQDRCEDHWRTVLGLGAGVRWYVADMLYLGVDYTWFSHNRHVLVGTIGCR